MPELPEVETVRRGIAPHVLGQTIARVTVREHRLRWPIPESFAAWLSGRQITALNRRGKYLLFSLDQQNPPDRFIAHLGMSGRLFVLAAPAPPKKHDHVDFELGSGAVLRYNDPRRFGAILPWPGREPGHPLIDEMGPEPLSDAFADHYLWQRSRGRSQAVKSYIMDGRIVVGVGNIYASESLFRAGIRPGTAAGRLSKPAYARLQAAIREVLAEAIAQGGTTLRDFVGGDSQPGYFKQDLYVYDRAELPCRICNSPIRKRVMGQRMTYYCSSCQQ